MMTPVEPQKAGPQAEPPPGDPLPRLVRALQSPESGERLAAIGDLARLGPLAAEAAPDIAPLLDDPDAIVRRVAARALGLMGPAAIPFLTQALTHADKDVRRQAIWALARLSAHAGPALPAIGQALRDADPRTASGAAQALANMGAAAAPAVGALLDSLQTNNVVQSRLISKALSVIGSAALPQLVERLDDPNPFVRREVAVAIGFMGAQAQPAVGAILEHLHRQTPRRPFEPATESEYTRVTPIKPTTAEAPDYRATLIDALARIGPGAAPAREYLLATLNDPDRVVGQAAAQALLRIMGWN